MRRRKAYVVHTKRLRRNERLRRQLDGTGVGKVRWNAVFVGARCWVDGRERYSRNYQQGLGETLRAALF